MENPNQHDVADRPSEKYEEAVKAIVAKSVVESLDWNFAQGVLDSVCEYLKECCTTQGGLPLTLDELDGEPVISVDIFEEGDVAFSLGHFSLLELCERRATEWGNDDPECEQETREATAVMLERVAAKLRGSPEQHREDTTHDR